MPGGRSALLTGATYAMLLVLGAVQGLFGSFQYSRLSPAIAIVLCLVIGATCLLAAWGMRSATGAFTPAAGWAIASFVMSTPASNGSVIIANSTAGKWYLYGGTITVALAVLVSFGGWFRISPR